MIKVAVYCRVSTDGEDQANSFESQQRYFQELIQSRSDWELYAIYADEGITGTTTKRRIQFNRMIQDAYEGQFRLVLTKEVSRFSRNVLDTIAYTRELKRIGVAVMFLTDNINTMDKDAELYLSILASLAQEESRRTSGRVVWGQTRQMEKGVVFGHSLLGYDVSDGVITVNPQGAETVKFIFQKYTVEEMGTTAIARFLRQEEHQTLSGSTDWTPNAVVRILKNEKYVGDLVQKKTYTPDFLTHQKCRNKGEVPLVCIKNHHEAIISRDVWNRAQERLKENSKHQINEYGHSNRYVFSGRIRCGECGAVFVSRTKKNMDGFVVRRWCCSTVTRNGKGACSIGKTVRDDDALYMVKTAIQNLPIDWSFIVNNVSLLAFQAIQETVQNSTQNKDLIRGEINCLKKKKEAVMDCFFAGTISKQDMKVMKEKYERQLEVLERKLDQILDEQSKNVNIQMIQDVLESVIHGETESELFYRTILGNLYVYRDRQMELTLSYLPFRFQFKDS